MGRTLGLREWLNTVIIVNRSHFYLVLRCLGEDYFFNVCSLHLKFLYLKWNDSERYLTIFSKAKVLSKYSFQQESFRTELRKYFCTISTLAFIVVKTLVCKKSDHPFSTFLAPISDYAADRISHEIKKKKKRDANRLLHCLLAPVSNHFL